MLGYIYDDFMLELLLLAGLSLHHNFDRTQADIMLFRHGQTNWMKSPFKQTAAQIDTTSYGQWWKVTTSAS